MIVAVPLWQFRHVANVVQNKFLQRPLALSRGGQS